MPRITWDNPGEKLYETGVDRGVLFPQKADGSYDVGVAWNGLTAVNQSPSGGDTNDLYADNIKYLSLRATEDYGATIEAFTYPDEFMECDGSKEIAPGVYAGQQARKPFGFSYRTLIGNDTEGTAHGYKLHLVYNATVSPSEKSYGTVNDSPDAINFSWEASTTPVALPAPFKPTAHIEIDSTKADDAKLTALENLLYGTENADPTLPDPATVISMMGTTGTTGTT